VACEHALRVPIPGEVLHTPGDALLCAWGWIRGVGVRFGEGRGAS
jgi:hypothetical protein